MKNLTIGINALNGISMLELNGLKALERVVIMRGGLYSGSGRLRVTNCAKLISIDIGEYAFMKYKNLELTNLTLLQRISIGSNAFQSIQTTVMESTWENEIMNQICLHFSPFNWETTHFRVTAVTNARWSRRNHTTTGTRWRCEVRYRGDEWIDLPSLTSFRGGEHNFQNIGFINLESSHMELNWCRCYAEHIQRIWIR